VIVLPPDLQIQFEKLKPFTQRVIETVFAIPPGQVMSYGEVAKAVGSPRAARQVVRVLSSCSEKYALPWHRVVNKDRCVALKDPRLAMEQIARLRSEGLSVTDEGQIGQRVPWEK
jgi:methylated-DNA-protein-cysteine methyltransferase-like protein